MSLDEQPVLTIEESMMWWHEMANHAERMGDYYQLRGEYDGVERSKAHLYRCAVVSLYLSETTGVYHCACHLRPLTLAHEQTKKKYA